jgi:hypothetical protein
MLKRVRDDLGIDGTKPVLRTAGEIVNGEAQRCDQAVMKWGFVL